jgi:hypothetical protein
VRAFPGHAGGQGDPTDALQRFGVLDDRLDHRPARAAALHCRVHHQHPEFEFVVEGNVRVRLAGDRQRHRAHDPAGALGHPDSRRGRPCGNVLDLLHVGVVGIVEVPRRQIRITGDPGYLTKISGDGGTDGNLRLHLSMVVPAHRRALRNRGFRD